jgi:ubiquinone/menaquinone biosynthesis C-methylase UbiE
MTKTSINSDEELTNPIYLTSQENFVRWYSSIYSKIPSGSTKIILDVGCGPGYGLNHLVERNRIVYGLDITEERLKNKNLKKYFIKADAHHLPFKNESVDVIICFELVEHLNFPTKFLEEATRTLKTKGMFFITTPTPNSPWGANFPNHVNVWERKVWISKLKELGFNVKVITYIYPRFLGRSDISSTLLKLLDATVGRAIGYWKKYVKVTSTKLVCVKTEK